MRLQTLAPILFLMMAAGTARAELSCGIIDAIDELHLTELGVLQSPDVEPSAAVLQKLQRQTRFLEARAARHSIENGAAAQNRHVLIEFVANARLLISHAQRGQARTVLVKSNFRSNLQSVGQYIRTTNCAAAGPNRQNTAAISDGTSAVKTSPGLPSYLVDYRLIIFITFGVLITAGLSWAGHTYARGQKRRAKRYDANYPTDYRIGRNAHSGVLLDISGSGTKLRHSLDGVPIRGTRVQLRMIDEWIDGNISWGNAHYIGIQFKRSIKRQLVGQIHGWTDTSR